MVTVVAVCLWFLVAWWIIGGLLLICKYDNIFSQGGARLLLFGPVGWFVLLLYKFG